MERRKPKLLIIGHGRHGKDTFADLVVAKMDLSFVSSSEFVGRVAIWEQWGEERYCSFSEFFEDRVNHRGLWFNFIVAYNTPDMARTGREMMEAHDVYVGMRNPDEFHACMEEELFDHVIWVDGSARHPPEGKDSNGMTKDMANIWIDNNGPEENLPEAVDNLQKRLHDEGYLVNMPGGIPEQEDYPHSLKNTMTEDPHDPPSQKPLVINDNEPTFHEYVGIINAPVLVKNPSQEMILEMDRKAHNEALIINDSKPSLEEYVGIINPPMVESVKCNGDCGCEDGSLCHENVCGPRAKYIVNPTLEESRKFHNDALMATCPGFTYKGGAAPAKPSTFRIIPEEEKWVDADWHKSAKKLEWEDMPLGATQVLDHGFFRVAAVMGSDQSIVDAARMSYGRGTKPVNSSAGLINYLVRNYHTSPLEMCEIKFHIRMPIFVMRQWVRHRTANLNEYSGRYSEMVRLFYVPEMKQICHQSVVNKQASDEPLPLNKAELAQRLIHGLSEAAFDEYENLLDMGVSRETARIILPLNTYTEVVWKLDISNLIKFLRLRDDSHAQWEIRQYAILVSKAVEEHFPLVFAAYREQRGAESFTSAEMDTLVNGNFNGLSESQALRMAALRNSII